DTALRPAAPAMLPGRRRLTFQSRAPRRTDSVLVAVSCHSWLTFTLRADGQVVDDAADAFGLPRHHTCPGAAGRREHRALERHDMVARVDVDVAGLRGVIVPGRRAHRSAEPPFGH